MKGRTTCRWDKDDDGLWSTSCDGIFEIIEGTPADNSMAFCCYCGKPLVVPPPLAMLRNETSEQKENEV